MTEGSIYATYIKAENTKQTLVNGKKLNIMNTYGGISYKKNPNINIIPKFISNENEFITVSYLSLDLTMFCNRSCKIVVCNYPSKRGKNHITKYLAAAS